MKSQDGRSRFRIERFCNPLLAERDENAQRQDWTPSEAVEIAVAIEEEERQKAKERREATQGRPKTGDRLSPDTAKPEEKKSRTHAAKSVGLSHDRLSKAKEVVEAASDTERGVVYGAIKPSRIAF